MAAEQAAYKLMIADMMRYGIIGYPLQHTFSPAYFNAKFQREGIGAVYDVFPMATVDGLRVLITAHPELQGLNVTIPHKQQVIPLLDELDDTAETIGAVNVIRIRNGRLKGYNTDAIGFTRSLQPLLQPQHNKALVLGTGGAAKAVFYALRQSGIPYRVVSRSRGADHLIYEDIDESMMSEYKLIINATPLGMAPAIDTCPDIPYDFIGPEHLLYDLVYVPEETLFLRKGKEKGAVTRNGYDMLIGQAEAAWEIWNR